MSSRLVVGICMLGMFVGPSAVQGQKAPVLKLPGVPASLDACVLLKPSEIGTVQGDRVTGTQSSRTPGSSFAVLQCFYKTAHFSNSVSLALAASDPAQPGGSGARDYWRERFHRKGDSSKRRKKSEAPRAVPGIGEEAFWVGNVISGALYILQGDTFLRISVGGPGDETSRIKRTVSLARHALRQLGLLKERRVE